MFFVKEKNSPKEYITFVAGNFHYDYKHLTLKEISKGSLKALKKRIAKLENIPVEEIRAVRTINEFSRQHFN